MRNRCSLRLLGSLCLPAFAFVLAPSPLPAQEKAEPNAKGVVDSESPRVRSVETASLARQLARYGEANQDAEALVLAADILLKSGAQELDAEKTQKGESSGDVPDPGEGEMTPSGLVELARTLAEPGSAAFLMIEEIESRPVDRGARGGPKVANDCVRALTSDAYTVTFTGGEEAVVSAVGDGDTDLDVHIYDEYGHLIVSDTGFSDRALVAWRPIWTGPFVIEVRNLGLVYNCYGLATN